MRRSPLAVTRLEERTLPANLPTGFSIAPLVTGLNQPTALEELPDGRLLIAEQPGRLRVASADGGTLATALALTVDSTGERGLLGVTLDPSFTANGYIYLYYTVPAGSGQVLHNRVSRFTLAGNTIDPLTETLLVDLDPLNAGASNHNGGALHFGPDGKLYVAVGENANPANSQSIANRLGKILRYNSDGTIPVDNPTSIDGIAGTTAGANRAIYAAGFRNPFTFAVDPASGRIYVNDVGQGSFEEVDELVAGRNYGWNATEGDFDPASFPNFTRPTVSYPHGSGNASGFAITGGTFYRPAINQFPSEYLGDYFFADLANRWIRRYDLATGTNTLFASDLTGSQTVDLDVTGDGSLLVLDRGNGGQVLRIQSTVPPVIPPSAPAPAVLVGNEASPLVRTLTIAAGEEVNRIDLNSLNLDPPFAGEARVARGFLNGDLFPEFIVSSGPGQPPRVVVLDGIDGSLISSSFVFESTFTGGVFVAAGDLDGDGTDDVIVSPDRGGGPRVRVFHNGDFNAVLADFFGIDDPNFRGGARVAAGDVTGDFRADLLVSAGFLGGPRIAGFDGSSVANGIPVRIFNDFFAFESTLRNGTFVAVGDVDGDGKADVVTAGGPGGGPRVQVFSGAELARGNSSAVLANFFAGDPAGRNGVRVAFNSRTSELYTGTAGGVKGQVFIYGLADLAASGPPGRTLTAFDDDFTGGIFVG